MVCPYSIIINIKETKMKTALQRFSAAYRTEAIKSKGTAAYWLTYAGPFFILLIFLAAYYFKGQDLLPAHKDPWIPFISNIWNNAAIVFLPMYLILLASQLMNTEHKNSTWRLWYTLPFSKSTLFWSKFSMLMTLNISAHLLTMALTLATGMLLAIVRPILGFTFEGIPWEYTLTLLAKVFLATFGILAIYAYVCFEFKSQVKSIGIGIALFIATFIVIQWKYAYIVPTYCSMTSAMEYIKGYENHAPLFTTKEMLSIGGYFALFTLAAWYRTCTKRLKA